MGSVSTKEMTTLFPTTYLNKPQSTIILCFTKKLSLEDVVPKHEIPHHESYLIRNVHKTNNSEIPSVKKKQLNDTFCFKTHSYTDYVMTIYHKTYTNFFWASWAVPNKRQPGDTPRTTSKPLELSAPILGRCVHIEHMRILSTFTPLVWFNNTCKLLCMETINTGKSICFVNLVIFLIWLKLL